MRKDSLNKENLENDRGPVFSREEPFLKERNLISAVGSCGFIAMDGPDRTAIRESSSSLVIVGF